MEVDNAFEILNGLDIVPEVGVEGPFITGGPSSPVGLDLPIRTLYLQNDTSGVKYFIKFGAGTGDWRQLSAEDLPFDPTNAENVTDVDLQSLGETLANRPYGKDFSYIRTVTSGSTSGGTFTTYTSLNLVVTAESTPNSYRINADFLWGHNSASNDIRVQLVFNGSAVKEVRIEPKDSGTDQRIQNNLLYYVDDLPVGTYSIQLQYRPATSSRTSRMYEGIIETWRVE